MGFCWNLFMQTLARLGYIRNEEVLWWYHNKDKWNTAPAVSQALKNVFDHNRKMVDALEMIKSHPEVKENVWIQETIDEALDTTDKETRRYRELGIIEKLGGSNVSEGN